MFELTIRFQIWEGFSCFLSKYLEIGGSGCNLVSKVIVEGMVALAAHWMAKLGVRSVFER